MKEHELMSKTVLIDAATAGASGDMILSALIDFLGDNEAIVPVAASLLIYDPSIRVKVHQDTAGGVSGKRLEVMRDKDVTFSPASLQDILNSVSEELELSKTALKFAQDALGKIIRAESKVHNTSVEKLQLHETGSVDTILDVIGTAYLLEKAGLLGTANVLCTKVAVGSGTIQTEHGLLDVPVPAVSEIVSEYNIPTHSGDATTEVLTPTGAAILATLVDEFVESADNFIVEKQCIGLGIRDLGEIPNLLRISVGVLEVEEGSEKKVTSPKTKIIAEKEEKPKKETPKPKKTITERTAMLDEWNEDEVIVIETTLDDVDGEVVGNMYDTLITEGLVYDFIVIPAYGKKNRPCVLLKITAPKTGLKTIASILIRELGTLGIRYQEWQRLKAQRETIVCRLDVDDKEYMVRVKIARQADGSIVNIKPEADDVIQVAKETGIPMRELKSRVIMQAQAVTE
jgi:uncharacterized protein (TIGR00299 family) protein